MINFPNTPTLNQIYTPVAGQSYIWDGTVWGAVGRSGIPDAPIDSRQYARQDAAWVMVAPLAHGKCQLAYVSTSQIRLRPFDGNGLIINGVMQQVPAAGVTFAVTGLTPSTVYSIYAFLSGTTMTLEASATAAVQNTAGVYVKTGDNTRTLVGAVYINTGPGFVNTGGICGVRSWFNDPLTYTFAILGTNVDISVNTPSVVLATYILLWPGEACDTRIWATLGPTVSASTTGYLICGYANPWPGAAASVGALVSTSPLGAAVTMGLSTSTVIGNSTGVVNLVQLAAMGYVFPAGNVMRYYNTTVTGTVMPGRPSL
jgi:hypothetical protein